MRFPLVFTSVFFFFMASVTYLLELKSAEAAPEQTALQKADIEKIIHDYLLSKPEVLKEAIDELDKRQKLAENTTRQKAVSDNQEKLFRSPHQAVVGNPNGDVTLVEFFDYNCGYCKRALASVAKLIETDPKLRVVLKDFAILGSDSQETAQVATAARMQLSPQKFWEFHQKLLSVKGHIAKAQALAVAKEVGADMGRLEEDLKKPETTAALQEVSMLAEALHFDGTPAWVVGQEAIVGGLPYAELKAKLDNIRKCGKSEC
ncbi:MAG: DsbA family protein [Methylocystaceae bacterium]|jgi:protein-disulfide isomerase|nr:DsbA family protein [Methylocystaceae bacterium]NBT96771.1 DsbA family protein [Methylocystaceae bacterium]